MVGGNDACLIVDDTAKPEIAIEEIDRVIASGARFGCVLADSGYGSSGSFRQALSERGLKWAVGLSRRQNVYPAEVAPAEEKWRRINWRRGTKGRLSGLLAARRATSTAWPMIACNPCRAGRSGSSLSAD